MFSRQTSTSTMSAKRHKIPAEKRVRHVRSVTYYVKTPAVDTKMFWVVLTAKWQESLQLKSECDSTMEPSNVLLNPGSIISFLGVASSPNTHQRMSVMAPFYFRSIV
jgi:hypothetical protein